MSTSKIEWTEKTWNPVTGCNKVSQGCKNCYAEIMHKRLMAMKPEKYTRDFLDGAFPYEPDLTLPMHWKKPKMIFVNSMSDLFHEQVPFLFIDAVFSVMADISRHTYQVLTKRPKRMLQFFEWKKSIYKTPWYPSNNVWLGVSCENQEAANERIPLLLKVPAHVRFLSCEPLLGPIDISKLVVGGIGDFHDGGEVSTVSSMIHWVIAGGESGRMARPMHPDWPRGLRDQCSDYAIPFFFKQWGEYRPAIHPSEGFGFKKKIFLTIEGKSRLTSSLITDNEVLMLGFGKDKSGRDLDGKTIDEMPATRELV